MRRIANSVNAIGHSRLAAEWLQQIDAAFASGSLLAGTIRLGTVVALSMIRSLCATHLLREADKR